LKICEEPPEHCKIFIIMSDKNKLSKPLYSRIQEFVDWNLLNNEEMLEFIESEQLNKNDQLLELSRGRPALYKILNDDSRFMEFNECLNLVVVNPKLMHPTPVIIQKCNDFSIRKIVAFICTQFANKRDFNSDKEMMKSMIIHQFAGILISDPSVNAEIYWKRMIVQLSVI